MDNCDVFLNLFRETTISWVVHVILYECRIKKSGLALIIFNKNYMNCVVALGRETFV